MMRLTINLDALPNKLTKLLLAQSEAPPHHVQQLLKTNLLEKSKHILASAVIAHATNKNPVSFQDTCKNNHGTL